MNGNENPLSFVRDNMEQGEFLSFAAWGSIKAFASVVLIIGAFIACSYLFSLQNPLINLNLIIQIAIFVPIYIWSTKMSLFKDFFITDKIDYDDNCVFLLKAQAISWASTLGFNAILYVLMLFWSAWDDPLSQAIFKILCLSIVASSFFIYTKREEVWTKTGFSSVRAGAYLIMGLTFGIGTYALGGIIIISSELLGWVLTTLGIGLEIILSSVYTYMDLQYWVKDYKRRQVSEEQFEITKKEYEEQKDIASRLGGKFGNA